MNKNDTPVGFVVGELGEIRLRKFSLTRGVKHVSFRFFQEEEIYSPDILRELSAWLLAAADELEREP